MVWLKIAELETSVRQSQLKTSKGKKVKSAGWGLVNKGNQIRNYYFYFTFCPLSQFVNHFLINSEEIVWHSWDTQYLNLSIFIGAPAVTTANLAIACRGSRGLPWDACRMSFSTEQVLVAPKQAHSVQAVFTTDDSAWHTQPVCAF